MNNIVEATVEIPAGTKNKYEIDKVNHRIKLNRVQYSSMTYPAEYGFIENTLEKDGDPLDILILTSEPTFPGCIIDAKIVGVLKTIDNGFEDNKIIAVNHADPRFDDIEKLSDIKEHTLSEIKHFFANYKTLQNIKVEVFDFYDKEEALKILETCRKRYQEKKEVE